jgi:NMD protein affecting ribosome stability and mRNA decay
MARNLEGKHGSYFEAVLQLRDVSQEVVDFAESEIDRLKMNVPKVIIIKNGVDYLLTDNTLTRRIGRNLQAKFGGKTEETSSLWGMKKDREVYRVTVLFRGVPFKKNDLVIYQGEEYKVKILSKDIFLQNTKTGKKVHVKYKDMKEIKKVD